MKNILLFILTSAAFASPKANFAQAPNLATASTYALFTSAGAFTNNGVTLITGDIGTNVGALTGFPPGIVAGQIQVANPITALAAMDVCAAYGQLSAPPCGFILAPLLGNGQILAPGVHCSGAASTLNGNLILDGQGDPAALFIIKIGGAFATGNSTNIILINGANQNNVYWQINGAFTLGDFSVFRGTVITSAGAIELLDGSTLNGRALACAGAITLHSNVIINPFLALPMTLIDFSATRQGDKAFLKWSTSSEHDSKDFIVERSNNALASTWAKIGTMPAAGTSSSVKEYSMTDNNVRKGNNFYRLRMNDMDGSFIYSKIRIVQFDESSANSLQVFPNPVKNNFTVTGVTEGSTIILTDIAGRSLIEKRASGSGTDEMVINKLLPGIYLLKVVSAEGRITSVKLSKQ